MALSAGLVGLLKRPPVTFRVPGWVLRKRNAMTHSSLPAALSSSAARDMGCREGQAPTPRNPSEDRQVVANPVLSSGNGVQGVQPIIEGSFKSWV